MNKRTTSSRTPEVASISASKLPIEFYKSISLVVRTARESAYRAVNTAMLDAYWDIGRMIVEEEQQGQDRAQYGAALLRNLSIRLTRDFGKGFDETNLRNMRQFFMAFPIEEKRDALRRELTWTHYRYLMRVENSAARTWYSNEAIAQNWSSRVLSRQIGSQCYERLVSKRDKELVSQRTNRNRQPQVTPKDFIKDPLVLEFLNVEGDATHLRESNLEHAIVSRLQDFMLELGRGFSFGAYRSQNRRARS